MLDNGSDTAYARFRDVAFQATGELSTQANERGLQAEVIDALLRDGLGIYRADIDDELYVEHGGSKGRG